MKRLFSFLCLGSVVLLMLTGCMSMPGSNVTFDVEIEYEQDNPAVTLEITPGFTSNLLYGQGFSGFNCTFTNNTDKSAKVVWDESSLNYDGNSYVPFIDGQKYANAQVPMSPAVIAKGSVISKSVYSSNQPYFSSGKYGGWSMKPIRSSTVQLLFCIKSGEGEEYITATVTYIISEE